MIIAEDGVVNLRSEYLEVLRLRIAALEAELAHARALLKKAENASDPIEPPEDAADD